MDLYSKTFYKLNFQKKKNAIRNLQVGVRVWSMGDIFNKKINEKWRAHKASPPIITKVKTIQTEPCHYYFNEYSMT